MFFREFESVIQHDKTVVEINFSEINGDFVMEILTNNVKEATILKGDLIGLRGIYNMDAPTKQNFNIACDENSCKVQVKGCIFNAFNILKDNKLISDNFVNTILVDREVVVFLDRTKDFILPENKIVEDESTSSDEMEDSAIQENYFNYLKKLDDTQLESALKNLSTQLSSTGTHVNVEVKILPIQNPQKTSVK